MMGWNAWSARSLLSPHADITQYFFLKWDSMFWNYYTTNFYHSNSFNKNQTNKYIFPNIQLIALYFFQVLFSRFFLSFSFFLYFSIIFATKISVNLIGLTAHFRLWHGIIVPPPAVQRSSRSSGMYWKDWNDCKEWRESEICSTPGFCRIKSNCVVDLWFSC